MQHYAALLLVAALAGLVARRYCLPGGTLLGALLASAAFTFADADAGALPRATVPLIQILVGAMLGLRLNQGTLGAIGRHRRLIAATVALTAATWGAMALGAVATGALDSGGAVLGSAPAGPAVTLLASDQGLPLGAISLLLVVRYALVSGVLTASLRLHALWRRGAVPRGEACA